MKRGRTRRGKMRGRTRRGANRWARAAVAAALLFVCARFAAAEPWTLRAVGNLSFGQEWTTYFEKEGPEYPFAQVADFLSSADWTIGFYEGTALGRADLAPSVPEPMHTSSLSAEALRLAGFDGVSLASPHAMDYGLTGLQDTMRVLDSVGVAQFGAGEDLAMARLIVTARIGEVKVAFTAFLHGAERAQALPSSAGTNALAPSILKADIAEAERIADVTIALIRWGYAEGDRVTGKQRLLAHMAVDAGADAVIGMRESRLQGVEIYRDRPILYSLSDFIRGVSKPKRHGRIMIPTVTFDGELPMRVDLTPVRVDALLQRGETLSAKLQPRLLKGENAESALELYMRLCAQLGTVPKRTEDGLRIYIHEQP